MYSVRLCCYGILHSFSEEGTAGGRVISILPRTGPAIPHKKFVFFLFFLFFLFVFLWVHCIIIPPPFLFRLCFVLSVFLGGWGNMCLFDSGWQETEETTQTNIHTDDNIMARKSKWDSCQNGTANSRRVPLCHRSQ